MKTISPKQLHERQQRGEPVPLLDVRTLAEHAEVHVPGVHLIPLDKLDAEKMAITAGFTKDTPLYVFCRSGSRAKQAAEKLERAGFSACHVVDGGTVGWAEAGLPVNRGAGKVISLERQVRIAAGLLVLMGVLLSWWVHPALVWLSGFVGAGLIFAGMTDWCGMGMLLARMPWNQAKSSPQMPTCPAPTAR
ncbi:rhodanese-related sulfurtransferase [Roseimicrobium gellanilyticum]|uniref:Rhodanese-related sulfurtransferase n=1 Tax=Roseimicrobium gellanilyticum TaxID=748857 RepID=A0A366H7R2_9BACT|nr:rhodanese-like domain-containing protein [Roseimicrobium gellanilyticum]RBP38190.1 rhodanese-related sulfurtransferase [Roseimicrobium gellanilyticum]